MNAGDRAELLAMLSLAAGGDESGTGRDVEMWSVAVANALQRAIEGEVGGGYGSALVRRSMGLPAAWRPVRAFLTASGLGDVRVVERQGVYALLADLLVDHCVGLSRAVGAPLSLRFVAGQAPSIAAVFDRAFPGYVAAGLARVVARRLANPQPA